jgi:hypothetical protein
MLRRSCLARVMEGVMYAPQGLASLPNLAQDVEPSGFHFKCLPGLYDRTQASEPFSRCHLKYNRRLIVAAPLTIGDVCLRTPFLVCTGSPHTYLHDIALRKFLGEYHNMTTGVLACLNVLGMDVLQNAAPSLVPMAEVLATDGKVTFPIKLKPEHVKVMDLKKAIRSWHVRVALSHADDEEPRRRGARRQRRSATRHGVHVRASPSSIVDSRKSIFADSKLS